MAKGSIGGAMFMIPMIELCRCSPGMVTALGVSMGLTSAAILSKGTIDQKERWALDVLTLDKIGAWAITEPNSGSDAFGSMQATARRDGDEYILNGSKTFITNGPYADTTVFICKLDEGNPPESTQGAQLRARQGHGGLRAVEAAAQDGHALVADRPAVPERRARRARPAARRDRGRARRRS